MITDEQYFSLVSVMTITKTIDKASKIARMHRNTARKYLRAKKPPSLLKKTSSRKNLKPVIQDCYWREIVLIKYFRTLFLRIFLLQIP